MMVSFGTAASCYFFGDLNQGRSRSSKRLTSLLLRIKAGFALLLSCLIETWKLLKSLAEEKAAALEEIRGENKMPH